MMSLRYRRTTTQQRHRRAASRHLTNTTTATQAFTTRQEEVSCSSIPLSLMNNDYKLFFTYFAKQSLKILLKSYIHVHLSNWRLRCIKIARHNARHWPSHAHTLTRSRHIVAVDSGQRRHSALPHGVQSRATGRTREGVPQGELRVSSATLRAGSVIEPARGHHQGTDDAIYLQIYVTSYGTGRSR